MSKPSVKRINLKLESQDGNAFALMGVFQKQARKEGWTRDEVLAVLNECQSGDYDNLLRTLMKYCEWY